DISDSLTSSGGNAKQRGERGPSSAENQVSFQEKVSTEPIAGIARKILVSLRCGLGADCRKCCRDRLTELTDPPARPPSRSTSVRRLRLASTRRTWRGTKAQPSASFFSQVTCRTWREIY